ncbi:radical SAM family heme chaperone HemW [Oceanicaulis alexandrii]|mgnify:FL=1|uniref:radical SAM family heme chaperone HemW n=1 Tax=Oceanicaulis alexandrii TaxID=153233 RepID=UPI0003B6054E|nr:radical SAM family heme chaperone HemW [Oceanicaulis alexandrii]
MSPAPARLGLYVHWPYCARICPYCDFNVYKAAHAQPEALLAAMLDDLAHWRDRLGPRTIHSVHFGGGTPSLMEPAAIAAILEQADALFGLEDGCEIGLEANPMEHERFAGIASAGVERMSLGVQALDDASLKRLGRDHDARTGLQALESAQSLFQRVSLDLIYAREQQTPEDWRTELETALSFGTGHMSLYQLTIEPGTAFERKLKRGSLTPPTDDAAADMYALTQSVCAAAGLPSYEISNHARSRSDQSVHNRLYWEGEDWIGIGPGAHSRTGGFDGGGREGAAARLRPDAYITGVAEGDAHEREQLNAEAELTERLLMGIRLTEDGLDLDRLFARTGLRPDPNGLERMTAQSLIRQTGSRLVLTESGRAFADHVAEALIPDFDA